MEKAQQERSEEAAAAAAAARRRPRQRRPPGFIPPDAPGPLDQQADGQWSEAEQLEEQHAEAQPCSLSAGQLSGVSEGDESGSSPASPHNSLGSSGSGEAGGPATPACSADMTAAAEQAAAAAAVAEQAAAAAAAQLAAEQRQVEEAEAEAEAMAALAARRTALWAVHQQRSQRMSLEPDGWSAAWDESSTSGDDGEAEVEPAVLSDSARSMEGARQLDDLQLTKAAAAAQAKVPAAAVAARPAGIGCC